MFAERIRASQLPILEQARQVGWSHGNTLYAILGGARVRATQQNIDRLQALAVMVGHPINKLFAESAS
jgi:hypothetical protein